MKVPVARLVMVSACITTFALAASCRQETSPTNRQSSGSGIAGGDAGGLAEAFVTALFIAREQARESGECAQAVQPAVRRNDVDPAWTRLICLAVAREDAGRGSSAE
jgi:hypothetical protein